MPPVRKILAWLLVIFVVYAILAAPTQASSMGRDLVSAVGAGIHNIFVFFDSLIGS